MQPLRIAVAGSGISGLGAAWLLSQRHDVTLFERESRIGGHSNTVDAPTAAGPVAVDTGFIVYNPVSYPNLIALFEHLDVPTAVSAMSFAVSLDDGGYEYSGTGLSGLFGQPSNLFRPSHFRMIHDTLRFFRQARMMLARQPSTGQTLGDFLSANNYSDAFVTCHILPMAAAIWSTPTAQVLAFPVLAFMRFFDSHGLLQATNQPQWRTVAGGSRMYIDRLQHAMRGRVERGTAVRSITRGPDGVDIVHAKGHERFDACVVATHADEALALLADPDPAECALLGAFRYTTNLAVLHTDTGFMPRRRRLWSSWNYLGRGTGRHAALSVSYWMNNLQPLASGGTDLFVTLNPDREIARSHVIAAFDYTHPLFDQAALSAQRRLWTLQGQRRTWFCGSYFGYGFHEDGLQSGLAAAEAIGGVRRPWTVPGESGRIHLAPGNGCTSSLRQEATV